MRIAVIGGGPGGLYFSSLIKQLDPSTDVTVWERNAPDDTFGFGVVFSDQTLSGIKASDPSVFEDMGRSFAYWDDVDVDIDGVSFTVAGNGFAAMSRKELLHVLQRRAKDHGVPIHFRTEAPPVEQLMADYDLVIACDGINSAVREKFSDEFGTTVDPRICKYMWLGTDLVFEAFEFFIRTTPYGVMQIHAYPMDAKMSTFIVEMHEDVWRGSLHDAVRHAADVAPRGEYVIVLEGARPPAPATDDDITAALRAEMAAGASKRDAAARVAAKLGAPKRRVYELALQLP